MKEQHDEKSKTLYSMTESVLTTSKLLQKEASMNVRMEELESKVANMEKETDKKIQE